MANPGQQCSGSTYIVSLFGCSFYFYQDSCVAISLDLKIELEEKINSAIALLFTAMPVSNAESCSLLLCSLPPPLDLQSGHGKEHVTFYILKMNAEVLEILS